MDFLESTRTRRAAYPRVAESVGSTAAHAGMPQRDHSTTIHALNMLKILQHAVCSCVHVLINRRRPYAHFGGARRALAPQRLARARAGPTASCRAAAC